MKHLVTDAYSEDHPCECMLGYDHHDGDSAEPWEVLTTPGGDVVTQEPGEHPFCVGACLEVRGLQPLQGEFEIRFAERDIHIMDVATGFGEAESNPEYSWYDDAVRMCRSLGEQRQKLCLDDLAKHVKAATQH